MGDRANIKLIDNKDTEGKEIGVMWLYTHWGGHSLFEDLKSALIRGKSRWDDDSYLARIIFSEMIQGEVLDTTGYGLSTQMGDGGEDFCVDLTAGTVVVGDPREDLGRATFSFQDFIELEEDPRDGRAG